MPLSFRSIIDDWLWERRFSRLEREASRLRRGRLSPPMVVWANGTFAIWSAAVDCRLDEIETELGLMLGLSAAEASGTVH